MRIVIDGRFWGPGHTGLGVYTKKLVSSLVKLDTENEYIILVRKEFTDHNLLAHNFRTQVVDIKPYSLSEQVKLLSILLQLNPDLVHFPSINVPILYPKKFVVTIHDLIKHHSKGVATSTLNPFIYWLKYYIYQLVVLIVCLRSNAIITPSKAVANDVKKSYPFTSNKITTTYEANVLNNKTVEEDINFDLPLKYALYAGNAYPHKNLGRLIEAWEKVYDKTKVSLVIACARNTFVDRIVSLINDKGANKKVFFVGYPTDGQLVKIHKKSLGYVAPSLMEGFGIPPLDAMYFGIPVICSNILVFKEVYGDAALFFDPTNVEDMSKKIIEGLTSKKMRKTLIENGLKKVGQYSWEKLAEETLSVYKQTLS